MTSDIMFVDSKTYFNMKKFEDSISNKGIERQKRIAKRRRMRIVDGILVAITLIASVVFLTILGLIVYKNVKIMSKEREIAKLEVALEKAVFDNAEKFNKIKTSIKYENLKMKAYLELNMITPTDKNVIYFDKSD